MLILKLTTESVIFIDNNFDVNFVLIDDEINIFVLVSRLDVIDTRQSRLDTSNVFGGH